MRNRLRKITPLSLAFISLLVFVVPAWALNDQRFTQPRIYDASDGTSEVITADFNGDNTLDLATANRSENDIISDTPSDGDVSIIFGNPDGTFGATTEIDSFGSPGRSLANTVTDIIAADLDDDDDMDLAFTDLGDPPTPPGTDGENNGGNGYLITMLNDGSGTFERRDAELMTGSVNPVELVAANFDTEESDIEIAVANAGSGTGGSVTILRNSGDGNFTEESNYTANATDSVQSIATADFDNDGQQDLTVVHDDGINGTPDEAFVYEGVSGADDRTFTPGATITVGDAPRHVITANLNTGDQSPDIATANFNSNTLSVALGNNNGTFAGSTSKGTGMNPYSLVAADFNIDGKQDLAAANSYSTSPGLPPENNVDKGTVSVLNGNGNGTFQDDRENETADGPIGIAAGRFNSDTLPDIATANFGEDGPDKEDGSVAVLLGKFQCDDGADNDVDGKTDLAEDIGCDTATDNSESPDPPNYSINDVTVAEGNTDSTATFTVTRAGDDLSTATSVSYTAVDGTAVQPADYALADGTLNFGAGETSKQISVTIKGDTKNEQNENYTIELSSPTNGSKIADGVGLGTINDNDPPPAQCGDEIDNDNDGEVDFPNDLGCTSATDNTESPDQPGFSINDKTVTEGDTGTTDAVFTVTRSGDKSGTSTVAYATQDGTATAPADYQMRTGTLTFDAGETSKQITVPVNGDNVDEDNETFKVNLSSPTNASIQDNQGIGTITDDDLPAADLALTLSDNPDPVRVGRKLTYTITVTNNGPNTAGDVSILNRIPRGVTYLDGDSSTQCSPNGRDIVCQYGNIANGETETREVVVKVNRDGNLTDTARIFDRNTDDPNPGNDDDTETTRARN